MANLTEPPGATITIRSADDRIYEVLRRIGFCLQIPIDKTELDLGDVSESARQSDDYGLLIAGAQQVGVLIKEAKLDVEEIFNALTEGYAVIFCLGDDCLWVCEGLVGKRVEVSCIADSVTFSLLRRGQLRDMLEAGTDVRAFLASKELACDSLSGAASHSKHEPHGEHHHPKPLRRFLALLRLDQRDIWTVVLFASVAGILALATPLAIESLVNVVSWGTYIQPLLVLAFMLLACLGIAGVLRVLQTVVVEIIQRRQLVRIVGDLSHRFPRANQAALAGSYPRELANRVFDIMTIQKSSAILLLDGVSIVLTTVLGLLLLAFYHPFLLGFDLVLILCMLTISWILGRGGIRTAIDESITKYRIAHWLQDVLATPAAFKANGGEMLAIERANRLTSDYIAARQRQFRVVFRQVTFAIGLQVVASTVLLGLGGWLVMRQQLTLGQLVASELVVTAVVGAFAKAGKTIEKFYDLMAGIDKVGHLLDIPIDPRYELGDVAEGPAEVRWEELTFEQQGSGTKYFVKAASVAAGKRVAIVGNERSVKSLFLKSLAGLANPYQGMAEVNGMEARRAALAGAGKIVGYAGCDDIFHSSIQENVDLARIDVGQNRVREVLMQVGLWETILKLPDGMKTMLQSDGAPLTRSQQSQLSIARAMAGRPKLLLLDHVLDELSGDVREMIWSTLAAADAPWTLMVVTNQREVVERCDETLELGGDH
jgi:putative ABC transport system ATP-binding protein